MPETNEIQENNNVTDDGVAETNTSPTLDQDQETISEHGSEKETEEFDADGYDYAAYNSADEITSTAGDYACADEDFVGNVDYETNYGQNNDFDFDCSDYSDADDDTHVPADDAIYRTFFEQLIEAREKSARKERASRFIPATRRYLNAPFVTREKTLNHSTTKNLLYLIKNIVSGRIGVNVADIDKELMRELLNKNTSKEEIRLHLIEDRRLHIYLRRALTVVEESKKYGGQCEKTDDVRQREVPSVGDDAATSYPTPKHSSRYQPYPSRSRIAGKSRGNVKISTK
ncbi:Hypothetical predicted protein [Paramuricea clavata]|uniref:Uncharacterized protein n=1 Tax=Paramuricea clavata TaxID=317549 RepID=A0A6S7JXS1_PARCT|nr:Hypothetical predicted protein [Paramuricea clavata]